MREARLGDDDMGMELEENWDRKVRVPSREGDSSGLHTDMREAETRGVVALNWDSGRPWVEGRMSIWTPDWW